LLETDVPWDDAIVVPVGKLRKTVGFPEWTAHFSVWKTTRKDSSEACAIACQNSAVYSVFPSGMASHSKIAQFNWECIIIIIIIIIIFNLRSAAFKAYCAFWVRRSNFHHQ